MITPTKTFLEIWEAACEEAIPNPAGAAGDLMVALARRLGWEQVQFHQLRHVALFLVDLSTLGFTGMEMNVFMVTHPPRDAIEQETFLGLLREYRTVIRSFGVCFHVILGPSPPRREQLAVPEWHVVRMYHEDVARVIAAVLPLAEFYAISRNQIEVANLCPFNTTREARGSMFVGRGVELKRLVDHLDRGFVVTGARRIGKTSLLIRAFESLDRALNPAPRLEADAAPESRRVFFFNGLNWHGWQDCARRIAHDVKPKKEGRIDLGERNLSNLLADHSWHGKKPLLFFIDEFDNVVNSDKGENWPFCSILAEAVESKHVRVVVAGYRHVSRIIRDPSNPLYRKMSPLELPVLSPNETHALTAPIFLNLGIQVRNVHEFVRRISSHTGGFPFMVQFFGEELYRKVEKLREPALDPDDVDEVARRGNTIDFIYEHILENTKIGDRVQTIERLCCFLYASSTPHSPDHYMRYGEPWDEQRFIQELDRRGLEPAVDEIHTVLKRLESAAILANEGGRFSFAFPLIPTVLHRKFPDLNAAIARLLRNVVP